ncbi:MAG: prefoldin subunit beta [Candidatus Aenigmatarchaeota archaeon]
MTVSKQAQDLIMQIQGGSQQLQIVGMQKQQLAMQQRELNAASEEVAKLGLKAEVFKAVFRLLVKTSKHDADKELKEQKDEITLKLKMLEKEETRLQQRLEETQEKIKKMLPKSK